MSNTAQVDLNKFINTNDNNEIIIKFVFCKNLHLSDCK